MRAQRSNRGVERSLASVKRKPARLGILKEPLSFYWNPSTGCAGIDASGSFDCVAVRFANGNCAQDDKVGFPK